MGKITFQGTTKEIRKKQNFTTDGVTFPYGVPVERAEIPEGIKRLTRGQRKDWFTFEGFSDEELKPKKKEARTHDIRHDS